MSKMNEYQPFLERWVKQAGKRPTAKEIRLVESQNLARPGSKAAFALAMALRPEGTTQPQIISVLGQPFRNKIKEVKLNKAVKVSITEDEKGVKRIKLVPKLAA